MALTKIKASGIQTGAVANSLVGATVNTDTIAANTISANTIVSNVTGTVSSIDNHNILSPFMLMGA